MCKSLNAARRLHAIYERALDTNAGGNAVQGWCRVFSVETSSDEAEYQAERKVGRLLVLVGEELTDLRGRLLQSGLGSDALEEEFELLHQPIRLRRLRQGNWGKIQDMIDEGAVRSLAHFGNSLSGDAPAEIPEEDLGEVKQQLVALSEDIREGDLPEWFTNYVDRQIETLLRSIREYRVIGRKAFEEAFRDLAREEHRHQQQDPELGEAKQEAAQDAYERFQDCALQVWTWYEVYCASESVLEDAQHVLQLIKAVFPEDGEALLSPPKDPPQLPGAAA